MIVNHYRYGLLLYRGDGSSLGSVPVTVDWGPAAECARFDHARRGDLPLYGSEPAEILPLWHRTEGEPYVRGIRVVHENNGRRVHADFPSVYFSDAAAQASAEFVKRGELAAGDRYLFQAIAFDGKSNGNGKPSGGLALQVVEEKPALELAASRLGDFQRGATPVGVVDTGDMPVFFSRRVLDEIAALTRAAEGCETGGILLGRLHHDAALPEIFAAVSAQIPAEHTLGTVAKLTFTAETWSAANAAIQLRSDRETFVGYWHSHPVRRWCAANQCSPEKQKNCALASNFFSEDDVAVMRAAFPRAYSLGLVANDTAYLPLSFSLFGWREGKVHARGFYLLQEETHAQSGPAAR